MTVNTNCTSNNLLFSNRMPIWFHNMNISHIFQINTLKSSAEAIFAFYLSALILVTFIPFFNIQIKNFFFNRISSEQTTISELILNSKKKNTVITSIISQLLFAGSFFFCLSAANIDMSIYQCLGVVPVIFLCAALPLSLAGFGPREYGVALILPLLGFALEQSVASSILFGLTITLQGVGFLIINLIFYSKAR